MPSTTATGPKWPYVALHLRVRHDVTLPMDLMRATRSYHFWSPPRGYFRQEFAAFGFPKTSPVVTRLQAREAASRSAGENLDSSSQTHSTPSPTIPGNFDRDEEDEIDQELQDESLLAYRKALGAIRDEETELRVAAAVKQLAERASESWVEWARGDWPELATAIDTEVERRVEEQKRLAEEEARRVEEAAKRAKAAEDCRLEDERRRKDEEERRLEDERRAQEAADEELARIAAAEGLLDKGKGRARVDEEVAELSDDPSIKTPRTVECPFVMTEVDMATAATVKRQAGQKCDRCAGYRSAPVDCVWVENATTCERCAQFQQGCYFDKVSVLGKTRKTRGGGSTTKKRIRPTSPGPSVADSSGSKKRRVDEPPRPLLRLPLDGASRLGLEQDDLDALDLDDESRGIIRVIREERAHIARRRALLHDMDLDLQKMEKDALAKGGIGFVRGAVDED
ncbi:predicted protein [Postia placenta Mad-698-R]|nr:predicted protein [Postia placenta Mad-698-R]